VATSSLREKIRLTAAENNLPASLAETDALRKSEESATARDGQQVASSSGGQNNLSGGVEGNRHTGELKIPGSLPQTGHYGEPIDGSDCRPSDLPAQNSYPKEEEQRLIIAPTSKPKRAASTANSSQVAPHSVEAETGVLGSMISDARTAIPIVSQQLSDHAFYVPKHVTIFNALINMHEVGHMRLPALGDATRFMSFPNFNFSPMRIYWHKFCSDHPKLFKAIEKLLHRSDCRIILDFSDSGQCRDAYIEKAAPDAQHKEATDGAATPPSRPA
jgi:hypothetical protein